MFATGFGLLLEGYNQVEEMTEAERKKFFATQQEEVVIETPNHETIITSTAAMEEREVEDFETEELPKAKKNNLLQQVFSSVKNWFEVDNIGGDFK